jgi:hypothetical protein
LKQIRNRLTYANVMSSLAVFLILGGATAFAAVKKIGANEIKANSIKTGKIVKEAVTAGKIKNGAVTESKLADGSVTTKKVADNAVTTPKIANDAVTGDKANESTFSQVPSAANSNTVGGHSAACPANTTLIRGVCFDSSSTSASSVFEASDACRTRGGFLPSPLELRSTRDILDLGTGAAGDSRYTDEVYTNDAGTIFSTIVIADSGGFDQVSTVQNEKFICAYQLVT